MGDVERGLRAPVTGVDASRVAVAPYEPPQLRVLGSLAELTAGGTTEPDDGVGGAGDIGSF